MGTTDFYNYNNYTIFQKDGEKRGIFFRNPLQKIYFTMDYDKTLEKREKFFHCNKYLERINNPIIRFWERIKGNGNVVKNLHKWMEDCSFYGFSAKMIVSPIYFHRKFRSLLCVNVNDNGNIKQIYSYGYEIGFEVAQGDCYKEITNVLLTNGKKVKIKTRGSYHYTYEHIIEEILKK